MFPFALDPAPIKVFENPPIGATFSQLLNEDDPLKKGQTKHLSDNFDILNTDAFNFPLIYLDQKREYFTDITTPLRVIPDDLKKDLFKYVKQFPVDVIPHLTD